jgi:hypothetical protein
LRIEIPKGRTHRGDLGHRFKGTGGNISSTPEDCHIEETGVLELKLPEAGKVESTTIIDSNRTTCRQIIEIYGDTWKEERRVE